MAAAIAQDEARRRATRLGVASAGTSAIAGYPAARLASDAMTEIGLSLDDHRSQAASRQMIQSATLVVALTERHRDMLRQYFNQPAADIVSWDDLTGLGDVADPSGGGIADFRKTRDRLRAGMPAVIDACLKRAGVPGESPRSTPSAGRNEHA